MISLREYKARFFVLVFPLSFIAFSNDGLCGQKLPQKPVSFAWTIAAQIEKGPVRRIIPVKSKTTLRSGDQVKMYLKIEEKCFVYVVYQSSSNELLLLFPERKDILDSSSPLYGTHYLPSTDRWYKLDNHTGFERFHLIASSRRLSNLENLLAAYGNASAEMKFQLRDEIISMIKELSRHSNQLTITAEKPIRISGNMRSNQTIKISGFDDIKPQLVEVGKGKIFIKTYTINHKSR